MHKCIAENCQENVYGRQDYCHRHYKQIKRNGRILERTRYDPNEFIKCSDCVKIITYDRHCKPKNKFTVDLDRIEEVKKYKWFNDGNGYLATLINGKIKYYHRMIFPKAKYVDHKDGDTKNNKIENLRPCENYQNSSNRAVSSKNKSGRIGITWHKKIGKWQAQICIKRQAIHLGHFDDLQDAIKARKQAEQKYFGEFAPRER